MENNFRANSQVQWIADTFAYGFRRLPTVVWYELQKLNISGAEFRIIFVIVDKTIGYDKESDYIAFSQFQKLTNLSRQSVSIAIKKLEARRIILVERASRRNRYIFNVYYDKWLGKGNNTDESSKSSQDGIPLAS